MKKFLSLILVILLLSGLLLFTGCENNDNNDGEKSSSTVTDTNKIDNKEKNAITDSNNLVATKYAEDDFFGKYKETIVITFKNKQATMIVMTREIEDEEIAKSINSYIDELNQDSGMKFEVDGTNIIITLDQKAFADEEGLKESDLTIESLQKELEYDGYTIESGSITNTNTKKNMNTNVNSSKSSSLTTYKLNDDILVKNRDGEYRIKFTNIRETSDRNEYSDKQADRVVIIEYEYENISKESDLYISDMCFKIYDKNNIKLETYPVSVKYPDSISIGRKTTASVAFALNDDTNYLELEFYDNPFNSRSDFKVVLEW